MVLRYTYRVKFTPQFLGSGGIPPFSLICLMFHPCFMNLDIMCLLFYYKLCDFEMGLLILIICGSVERDIQMDAYLHE